MAGWGRIPWAMGRRAAALLDRNLIKASDSDAFARDWYLPGHTPYGSCPHTRKSLLPSDIPLGSAGHISAWSRHVTQTRKMKMTTDAYFNSIQGGGSQADVLRLGGPKATATMTSVKEQASARRNGQKRATILSRPVPRLLTASATAVRSQYNDEYGKAGASVQYVSHRMGTHGGVPRTCSVTECESTVQNAVLCPKHRQRFAALGTTALTTTRTLPPDDKFARRIEPEEYGCWMWNATKTYDKYPKLYVGGGRKEVRTHRWAYERFVGPIPDGYEIDHMCSRTLCVRPSHLQALTPDEHRRVTEARKKLKELTGDERSLIARGRVTVAERDFSKAHGLSPLALQKPAMAMPVAAR